MKTEADFMDQAMEQFEQSQETMDLIMEREGFANWDEAKAEVETLKQESKIPLDPKSQALWKLKREWNIKTKDEMLTLVNSLPWLV